MPGGGTFRLRGPLSVFIYCLVIASALWLVIRLSGNYSSGVNIKLRFVNVPKGKVLVQPLDSVVTLKFQSQGFKILSLECLKKPRPVYIDISKLKFEKDGAVLTCKLNLNTLALVVSEMNDLKDEYTGFEPENIHITMESFASKKVAVIPDTDLGFKKNCFLKGPVKVTPDSIIISGTSSQIHDINAVKTKQVKLKNLDKPAVVEAAVIAPQNGTVEVSPKNVELSIDVRKNN